mgnify:CR=1 FL=1
MTPQHALDKAIIGLFQKKCSSFLSVIFCGHKVIWDESIPTACTNGKELRINPDWWLSMSDDMRVTVLAHEMWHPALFHIDPARIKGRNFRIWNAACDHAINLMLKEHGYVFNISHLADERFIGMSAEQIYDILIQEQPEIELPFGEDFEPTDQTKPEEIAEIQQLVLRATVVSSMDKSYEDLPDSLKQTIHRLLNPKLPWETLLAQFLTERSEEGYSWRVPNRRYQHVYLPSRIGEGGLEHLVWAFDVSASVTDRQIATFLAEIHKAHDLFHPKRMTILTFDTMIRDVYEINENSKLDRLDLYGRGGTCMECIVEYAMQNKSSAMVVFSDLECYPPTNPKIPVLFICLDNPEFSMPFGKTIHLSSD